MSATPPSASAEAATPGWIWGPAGRDVELARAISDLTTGGYLGSTRALLALNRVPAVYGRRGYCSSVLAALIVRLGLPGCEHWLADAPKDPDALLMHARVQVVRAVHAARAESADAARLASTAAQACERAADAAPEDPTPWVALLSLGETGAQLPELARSASAPDGLPVYGPWGLFAEIAKRDEANREGAHRLIPCCTAVPAAAADPEATADLTAMAAADASADATARAQVAVWAAEGAPAGSPLMLLRLMHAARHDPFPNAAEEMRLRNHRAQYGDRDLDLYLRDRDEAMEQRWRRASQLGAVKLAEVWFADGASPPYLPLSDVSFLAYTLHRMGELRAARLVLEWMIPHATASPWQSLGEAGEVLAAVCAECNVAPWLMPR